MQKTVQIDKILDDTTLDKGLKISLWVYFPSCLRNAMIGVPLYL